MKCVCCCYATVTNKTDIVQFQRFSHHRRVLLSPKFSFAQSHIVRAPYDIVGFYTDECFYLQRCIHYYQNSPSILQRNVVKIRKTEADSDSDGGETHTGTRLHNIYQHLFVACYSFSAAQCFLSVEVNIYVHTICTLSLQIHVASHRWQFNT